MELANKYWVPPERNMWKDIETKMLKEKKEKHSTNRGKKKGRIKEKGRKEESKEDEQE